MLNLENQFFPYFDDFIQELVNSNNIDYFNYTKMVDKTKFKTYDGHHIDKYGGIPFTRSICDSIKFTLNN